MLFIYATDLHGIEKKYNDILNYALDNKIKLIHLGSDFLPKGYNITEIQKKFINKFLKNYFEKASQNGIKILVFFGNDDIYSRKKYFRKFGNLLNENPVEIEGILFKAYPYVCDYPFGLKSACKLDYRGWNRPFCKKGVDVSEKGFVDINDLDLYFSEKTTIEEDLQKEIVTHPCTVYAIHMPPANLELDVCGRLLQNGTYDCLNPVGSKSIYNWIEKEQPLLTLHGHIHESYSITGVWKKYLGKTLVVQPGQIYPNIYMPVPKTNFVLFEINQYVVSSTFIEI
jgi:Icc-related predicted phosphoesterase